MDTQKSSCSRPLVSLLFIACALTAQPAIAATVSAGFTETLVTGGLSSPTAMQFAPDGRLFVCEQGGTLRVIKNGALLPAPFLSVTVSSVGERGLLGIAFDPAFATNHFLYIYYTATTPAVHNRISRFTANGDVAVGGSELVILNLPTLVATNHNGGAIAFGPDGKLYAAVGENAVGSNSQLLSTPLGKMLRINANGTIPADNPFVATPGANPAVWAYGLRNPFTFAFDPAGPNLFINDVGEVTWEEIDDGIAGANYGWNLSEGPTSNPAFKSPRYAYTHASGGCAITGGAFYSPLSNQFPADYLHDYFFADFCGGWIDKLDPASGNSVVRFATGIGGPVDLKVADDGALYYLARGFGSTTGVVNRIEWTAGSAQTDVVRDTFSGTAGTALTAHSPNLNLSGNPWTVIGSTPAPTLVANGVGVTAGTGHVQATIDSGISDITMAVDYRVGSGPGLGALAFRVTDTNNLLLLETLSGALQLYRRNAGTWILLASQPLPAMPLAGSVHRLQIRARGSALEGWWDGTRLLQISDTFQQTATRHGLGWNSAYDPTSVYANFLLTTNGPPSRAPTINTQPQSRMILSGQTAALSVAASGTTPLSYQWYLGSSGTTTTPIAAATSNTFTTPALTSNTSYWVRVSNASGTADSSTATITIGVPPAVTTQPQSQTIASGQTATLTVAASGTAPLTYQWYLGASGTTTVPIAGATGNSYITPALLSTRSHWVRVTNGVGVADSSTATISVTPPPGLLVQDAFTGTPGAALPSHLPDVNLTGNAWTIVGATPIPTLTANGVGVTAGSGHLQATIDAGVADVAMGVTYRVGNGPGMGGLAFRLTDTNNFFVLETYANGLYLFRRMGGVWMELASAPLPMMLVSGSTHRLEVRAQGSMIEGWWDGVRLLQAADMFQQTATRHGLNWNSAFDPTSTYTDFQLTLNAPPAQAPTVTVQPQSRTIASGQAATLTVAATGTAPLTYQWYIGTSGTTTTPVAGASGSSYTTPALVSSRNYWVRVTNGTGFADSSTATLTVAPALGLLVQDAFTGTPGSLLTAHLPDMNLTGNPWTVTGGTPIPTLMASGVGVMAGSGHLQATIDTGAADIVMGVDYRVGSGPGMGALAFRLTDANNFFVLETYANGLYLFRRMGGEWMPLASAPLPTMLVSGSTHRLEVRAQGSMIEGWWDGVQLLQAADMFQQTATRHGLDWNSAFDPTSIYADFQLSLFGVTAPSAPPPPGSPVPVNGATGVGTTAALRWSAAGATTWDVSFGTSNPPPSAMIGLASATYTPPVTAAATTYFWQVTAHNATGATTGPIWSFTTASVATPSDLLVLDTFAGTPGTMLTAHLPDVSRNGNGWTLNGGAPTPTLVAGGVGVTAGLGHLQVTVDTGVADIAMGVDYRVGNGPGMGVLVFRLTDANNFLLLETYANALYLYKRQGGDWIPLAAQMLPAMLVSGTTHRLEVRTLGNAIEGWWDGVRLLQVMDGFQQTATRHGLDWNSMYDATSTYGNFQITSR